MRFLPVLFMAALSLATPLAHALACEGLKVDQVTTTNSFIVVTFEAGAGDYQACRAAYHSTSGTDYESVVGMLLLAKSTGATVAIEYGGGQPLTNMVPGAPGWWARDITIVTVD